MEIYMRKIALAATSDDVKIELAKILHKAPFPIDSPLNFDVFLFKRHDTRGKAGILTLPDESAGRIFLRAYGTTGLPIKGPTVLFTPSARPLNEERVAILRSTPWRDPQRLRMNHEQRIQEGRPYALKSYAFGRFLRDESFSSEFVVQGSPDIACDLERRMVRFTLRKQSQRSDMGDDISLLMMQMSISPEPFNIASYPPKSIDSIVQNATGQGPVVFIRANTFPLFSIETPPSRFLDANAQPDIRRSQGLIPDVQMPPGCFSLMCTFDDEDDKEAFVYAAQRRLQVRCTTRQIAVQVRDNTQTHQDGLRVDFLKDLPFELAFELEKAITNWTLSGVDARLLRGELERLCHDHGDAAAQIFRRFIVLLEDMGRERSPRRRRRRGRGLAMSTLEGRLRHATDLYLEEQQRPKGRLAPALSSAAVSYTYHVVLTPTRYVLEGPVADQSNSVLRRFRHHECFLRVSFQDENRTKLRRDLETSISDLLAKRYRPKLLNGFEVAGRHYHLLGYSMSGLKEHSLWFVTPFRDDRGQWLDAATIRESLGDFTRLSHQPARLGARWSQAFSATDPSIVLEPQEILLTEDIESPTTGKVMTDGCSAISPELARAIWRANQREKKRPARGKAPSAYQFRLGGAKGMVVQDPTLEGRVVCLRPSQVKFEAPNNRSFDIQSTSLRPKAMFLNRPLIVLLEYLGSSSERIVKLQDRSINEAKSVRRTFTDASKVLQQHGLGTSFHLPSLLRNMSTILHLKMHNETGETDNDGNDDGMTLYNDLISKALHCAETHILRELKYRAHIAVPGSFTLLGVSDEWDCLEEGEIFATVHDEKTGLYKEIEGTVAITRSPQIHPGDVQKVTAVRRPELAHLTNVVVFSCRGDRPLSSCLGGGDLDGDDFNIILDPELIPEDNKHPGDYISLPIKRTPHECGIEDVVDFIFDYMEADLVGQIAISHLRFSDLADPSCDDCLRLAELASQAVDFPKTGTAVEFRNLPRHRNREKPDFLAREGADLSSPMYYTSQKLLGVLYRRVPVKDYMPNEWSETHTPSGGDTVDRALRQIGLYGLGLSLSAPNPELADEMQYLLDDYCERLLAIAQNHTVSKNKDVWVSESELVSGTIMANWSDHHRRREAVGAMNLETHELARAVRAEMKGGSTTARKDEEDDQSYMEDWYEDEDEGDFYRETRQVAESFKRAWAGWCAAETALREEPGMYGAQSFGLIALGRMLDLVKAARQLV